jgi:hypothetical protein
MARTRQPALTAILTAAARDIHRATRTTTQTPSLDQLREHGWQLAHLTGGLAELAALLAEHTGHLTTTHPGTAGEQP